MKMHSVLSIIVILISGLFSTGCDKTEILYAGRFTKGDEKGLNIFEFNTRHGSLTLKSQEDVGPSPSFFCLSKNKDLLYVINEVMEFKGNFGGGLTTLSINPETGAIAEKINEMLIPWAGPCYISLSADTKHLLIANYPNGSVVVVKLNNEGIPETISDTILYVKEEPDRSHAHMIQHDPSGKFIYVADLGLDRIIAYEFDTVNGKLIEVENGIAYLPKNSGPRHFVFKADGSKLYVINELASTIAVFDADITNGRLLPIQIIKTTSDDFIENNYCAEIAISKDGRFLYGSNRGENTIVVFRILPDGRLEFAGRTPCGGNWPRNFIIDPDGKFLIVGNQKSGDISVFRLNKNTGLLKGPVTSAKMPDVAFLLFK